MGWGLPGRGGILSGKINFGKSCPGKILSQSLKMGCPLGVWKVKMEIRREVPKKFLAYIIFDDKMKFIFP
jgi:hypothetical protein